MSSAIPKFSGVELFQHLQASKPPGHGISVYSANSDVPADQVTLYTRSDGGDPVGINLGQHALAGEITELFDAVGPSRHFPITPDMKTKLLALLDELLAQELLKDEVKGRFEAEVKNALINAISVPTDCFSGTNGSDTWTLVKY